MSKMEEAIGNIDQPQLGTKVTIYNMSATQTMKLDRHNDWAGHPSGGSYPEIIQPNSFIKFLHVREGQSGSSGAVQYSCDNADHIRCAWILAWHSPADNTPPNTPNKVYVTCGTKSSMNKITWEQILLNLEDSEDKSHHEDPDTKTTADASIDDSVPKYAVVVAKFGFMNCDN